MKQQIWERSSSKLEESSWNLIGVGVKLLRSYNPRMNAFTGNWFINPSSYAHGLKQWYVQGTKRIIIFKSTLGRDILVPRRVDFQIPVTTFSWLTTQQKASKTPFKTCSGLGKITFISTAFGFQLCSQPPWIWCPLGVPNPLKVKSWKNLLRWSAGNGKWTRWSRCISYSRWAPDPSINWVK